MLSAAVLFIFPQNVDANIREGLVGWWKLDETSGTTAIDWSGKNNNGTYTGTTAKEAASCKRGGCRSFNGASDLVTVADNDILDVQTGDFTVGAWVKIEGNSTCCGVLHQTIVAKGDPASGTYVYTLLVRNDGRLLFALYDGTNNPLAVSTTTYLPTSAWHHFAGVYKQSDDGTALKLYIDGVLHSTATRGSYTTAANKASTVLMGEYPYAAVSRGHLNGRLDDVRLYNRALSAQEVSDLFRAGTLIRNAKISNAHFNQ